MSNTPNQEDWHQAISQLHQRLMQLETREHPIIVQTQSSKKTYKIALPEKFDGSHSKFRDFLAAVNNYIAVKENEFSDDEAKSRFIGSLLCKEALTWYRHICETNVDLLLRHNEFINEFTSNFDDPNSRRNAQEALARMKQGKFNVASYGAKFRRLASETLYNETALIVLFRRGLNDEIKDVLCQTFEDPDNLEDFIKLCTKIDQRLAERRIEKSLSRNIPFAHFKRPNKPARNNNSETVPMEIDSMTFNNKKKITDEERQHRKKNNLCMYCGKPNHIASNCPNKKNPKN